MNKLFSVLIPAYNREDCICQTVDSVLAQTFTDYEMIVIDDGSNDGTTELLQSYGDRIRFIQQANQGPEVARNIGASHAVGQYLALLDSDDLLLPCALATYEKIIRKFEPALILGAMTYFQSGNNVPEDAKTDEIKVVTYQDFFSKDIALGISSSKIVIRKSVFDQAGGLRKTTPSTFHCDDYNLLFQTGTSGPLVIVIQPNTVAYRVHSTNAIHNIEAMVNGVAALVDAEHNGKYPGGKVRRIERYARIGGPAQEWVRKAIKNRRPDLGFRLLKKAWPMIMACLARRTWKAFGPPPKLTSL